MTKCEMGDCCGGVCNSCISEKIEAEADAYASQGQGDTKRAWLEGYFRGLEDGKK